MTADATTLRALIARLEAGEALPLMAPELMDMVAEIDRRAATRMSRYALISAWETFAIAFTETVLPGARLIMSCGGLYSSAMIAKGHGFQQRILAPIEEAPNDEDLPRLIVLAALKAKLAKMEAA